jgi:homoserine dehydrogenase
MLRSVTAKSFPATIIRLAPRSLTTTKAMATIVKPPILRIGMFGGGTVGGGVYELLMSSGSSSSTVITKICVSDLSKPRSFHVDETRTVLTTDPDSILLDDSLDCIIECMGGTGLAKRVVTTALKQNQAVVTANKALLAEHLDELILLAAANKQQPSRLAFEAAVCGGIPIIQTLQRCYTGDVIHNVAGIMNGTTNYMLTKMAEDGADYAAVLKEAQDLGFAEADPTADVEGHDVRAKIALLAKIAFGKTVAVDEIPCTGISKLTAVDFEYAALLQSTIKLVGTARRLPGLTEFDGALTVYVAPAMIPYKHRLAGIRGAGNAVMVQSANMGICSYTGPGAGRYPTANSIVADVHRVASGAVQVPPFPEDKDNLLLDSNYGASFYIRIPFCDSLGIIRTTGELAERHGISIHSILQNPIGDRMMADFCLTTEDCKLSQVQDFCHAISHQDFARDDPVYMPIMTSEE